MANTFRNALKPSIGTANTQVYQAGASLLASTVIGLSVANRTTANTIQISVYVLDSANSYASTYIVNNATVPIGGTIVVVGGDQKLVLKPSDSIQVVSSVNNSADAIMSVLEMS
jgi:16S rRNA G1207 methylase RsmC